MKKVSLNKQIRTEIISGVMLDWDTNNPMPDIGNAKTPSHTFLVERRDIKARRDTYIKRLSMALSTFRTVDELEQLWPQISKYVPDYITNPQEAIELP